MPVTRTLELELDELGVAVLEVSAAIEAHDTEVCVDEIQEIALVICGAMKVSVDPIRGFGLSMNDWLTSEFESRYADDWQEIATESRERYLSQLDDHEIAWRKDHREAS